MIFLSEKNKDKNRNQGSFDFSNGMPQGVSTTNIGLDHSRDINYVFVINPEKLGLFTKDIGAELKSAYNSF